MGIINDYVGRSATEHASAVYGCTLDAVEQRRRYIIKSLLRVEGLSKHAYADCFGSDYLTDFPELAELESSRLASSHDGTLALTSLGFERADTIGPWLYSTVISGEMQDYQLS